MVGAVPHPKPFTNRAILAARGVLDMPICVERAPQPARRCSPTSFAQSGSRNNLSRAVCHTLRQCAHSGAACSTAADRLGPPQAIV